MICRKTVVMPPLFCATYQILNWRIRRTRVATAAIMIVEIVTGDVKAEVDNESIKGSGQSVHW